MKTGKNETQNISEMLAEMNEAKEKGLTNNRGKSVYRKENGEYQEEKLKDLISMSITELAEVANKEKISLDDVEEVKRRTIYYMRACEESGTFPTSLGLARSLGYSDRALRHWRSFSVMGAGMFIVYMMIIPFIAVDCKMCLPLQYLSFNGV